MTDPEFLQAVKRAVLAVDPQAEVWLFGSRARGDARPDSDWDFLVLTPKPVDRAYKYVFWDHLNDLELATERAISTRVWNRENWHDMAVTDLYQNIQEDGKRV